MSKQLLERARALDRRNEKLESQAKKLLNKLAKRDLREMSILNDHILAEGVENLESESGRARFFENIKAQGLQCSREFVDAALDARKEDAGGGETEDDYGAAEGDGDEVTLLMRSVMVNFIAHNDGYSPSQERDEGQPLCMRGSFKAQDKDEHPERARCEKCLSIATEITGPLEDARPSLRVGTRSLYVAEVLDDICFVIETNSNKKTGEKYKL